jgi:hypothetical protein
MAHFWVRNVIGTTGRDCACGTWIDHFHNHTRGSRPSRCPVIRCGGDAVLGAHVTIVDHGTRHEWIVPMCHGCNQDPDDLLIDGRIDPVPANTQETGCYLEYIH